MTLCINRHPHLRLCLVEPPPPQARRRFQTRISVATPHMPVGRSRTFRLTESDIKELVVAASLMEARAS